MAGLKLAPYITLETQDNGDVYANVFSQFGQFIATLPFDNMFIMNQKDTFGSKIYGLGNQHVTNMSYGVSSSNKLHFYFFNTTSTATLNNEGKLPSFMDNLLNIDESKLVAYACDTTVIDSNKLKQGITKEREGIINTTQPVTGCTMHWPAGYGAGEINAMAVSLVDLSTLKSLSSTQAKNSAVFGGVQLFLFDNYYGYKDRYGYIGPNITGITTEDEVVLKLNNSIVKYNLTTGNKVPYELPSTIHTGKLPLYGVPYAKVNGKLYYTGNYGGHEYYIHELDITTKTVRTGGGNYDVDLFSGSIVIDGEVWFETARNTTTITLKKLDVANLYIPGTEVKTITLPSYFQSSSRQGSITQFENGDYGLVDNVSGICYRFTNIDSIESSIVDVYFTGSNEGFPIAPIKNGVNTQFLVLTSGGFYKDAYLTNKNQSPLKFVLTDGRFGPLIAYNKFDTSYNKSAVAELTSSFMITSSTL